MGFAGYRADCKDSRRDIGGGFLNFVIASKRKGWETICTFVFWVQTIAIPPVSS